MPNEHGGRPRPRLRAKNLRQGSERAKRQGSARAAALSASAEAVAEARFQSVLESELRLRLLLEQLPDVLMLVVDDELRYQRISGAGDVFARERSWQGKTLFEVSNSENVAILEKAFRDALAGTRSTVSVTATLSGRESEVTSVPFVVGGKRQALIVVRDATDTRGREMALRLVTQQFEQLVQESPTGIALADTEGRIALVNDAFCVLFGRPSRELVDTSAAELLPMMHPEPAGGAGPHDSGLHDANWVAALIDSGAERVNRQILLTAGLVEKRADVTAVVLRDVSGEPTSVLINAYDTSEQHRYQEHLAYLAAHDALTGLPNRTEFERLLDEHLDNCRWGSDAGAVLVLDLDNFREINDSLGHGAGDDFIVAMAALLSRWIRSTDVVARIGGDEFAVLLTAGDREHIETAVRMLVTLVRDGFQNFPAYEEASLTRRVTASVGAVAVTSEGTSSAELLSDADLAMYDAKTSGRNGYSFFDSSQVLAARVSNQFNWKEKILAAIENDNLVLHAQPILDLNTDTISSLELLVRMIDADGGLIAPGEFIAVAEQTGLAVMLDEWVVSHALESLTQLQQIAPAIKVHVNLSGRSVGDLEFAAFIERRIDETGVDATGLVLELTETAAVSSLDSAQAFMSRLTALGCVFALDDFGVGYGSFYYLKHLPFGIMKLDGEFVSGSDRDPLDRLVMSSLVSIGKGLGKFTIAEFVEDEASLDLLRELGVDGAQGYHIGRPAPLATFFPQLT
ncbi:MULTISPECIES: putative bifunctional diguanylate cyclase/phosphodiesterase [Subtercola]|nr:MULTISPECIES: EAL domain-containing protein [Subtercola]MEA9986831.1 EAL domain-containing protein [Subtercola sp. RTI3]